MSPGKSLGYFLTITGVMVISVNSTKDLFISYKKIIYSIFLAVLISCGLYFQVLTYFQLRAGENLLHGLLYLYPMIADSVMSILIILSGFYSNYVFLNFVRVVGNQDILIALIQGCNYKRIGYNLGITWLVFVGPYFLDFFYYHASIQSKTILYQALSYIFVLYNYVCLNQFAIVLGVIRSLFMEINRKIRIMCQMGEENVEELYKIRNQHHKTVKFCRIVNNMFAITNMGLFVHHGMLGVIYSYWGLRQMMARQGVSDIGELINTFRSAALSFLSIVWLVASTVRISTEIDSTKHLIQGGLINTKNKDFLSEMNTFSLQLKISDAVFSPYGFFEFSNELLLSMLSGIVSYLIILLQYQVMLDEQA